MTLPDVTLYPQAMLPLRIFEPRYRRMLADALDSHRMFAVAMQASGVVQEAPATVAGLGLIRASVQAADGTSNLLLQGLARVELCDAVRLRPYRVHRIRRLRSYPGEQETVGSLAARMLRLVDERLEFGFTALPATSLLAPGEGGGTAVSPNLAIEVFKHVLGHMARTRDTEQLADFVSATLLSDAHHRQLILETPHLESRLRILLRCLRQEIRRRQQSPQP